VGADEELSEFSGSEYEAEPEEADKVSNEGETEKSSPGKELLGEEDPAPKIDVPKWKRGLEQPSGSEEGHLGNNTVEDEVPLRPLKRFRIVAKEKRTIGNSQKGCLM